MSDVDLEAEVARLRGWKAEASSLFDGMQDLGRALGVPLGVLVSGPEAVKAAEGLAERARVAEVKVARVEALVDECAASGCIHLNTMWGRLRAALNKDQP